MSNLHVQTSTHKLLVSLYRYWYRDSIMQEGTISGDEPIPSSEHSEFTSNLHATAMTHFHGWQMAAHMNGNAGELPDIEHPFHGKLLQCISSMSVTELHAELWHMRSMRSVYDVDGSRIFQLRLSEWAYTWGILLSSNPCDYDAPQNTHELKRFEMALILGSRLDPGNEPMRPQRKVADQLVRDARGSQSYFGPDGMKEIADAIMATIPRERKLATVQVPTLTDEQWVALEQYLWGILYDRKVA